MMPGQDRVCFCSVLLSLHHDEEAGCGRPERRVWEQWQADADLRRMKRQRGQSSKSVFLHLYKSSCVLHFPLFWPKQQQQFCQRKPRTFTDWLWKVGGLSSILLATTIWRLKESTFLSLNRTLKVMSHYKCWDQQRPTAQGCLQASLGLIQSCTWSKDVDAHRPWTPSNVGVLFTMQPLFITSANKVI